MKRKRGIDFIYQCPLNRQGAIREGKGVELICYDFSSISCTGSTEMKSGQTMKREASGAFFLLNLTFHSNLSQMVLSLFGETVLFCACITNLNSCLQIQDPFRKLLLLYDVLLTFKHSGRHMYSIIY